jgi:HK97 family phage major capsid protein
MGTTDLPRLSEIRPKATPGMAGMGFVRLIRCMVVAKGDAMTAALVAPTLFPNDPLVAQILKTAANAGGTSGVWGSQLWQYQTLAAEFIEASRPSSIVGRLTDARRVPPLVRVARTISASTVGWVGDAAPKPVSEMAFDEILLGASKICGVVVVSQELAKSANPSAEGIIRADLIASCNAFVDLEFISPSNVAVADVHPGSILSGVTGIASAGATAANVVTDLNAAVAALLAGGSSMVSPLWILHPAVAVKIALLRDSQGGTAFPGLGCNGGTLAGIPAITSTAVPKTTSGGSIIVLLDQAEVIIADDSRIEIDTSSEASAQMSSTPSSAAYQQVSFWQLNTLGVRAERAINWAPRRAAAATAAYIDQVAY